MNKKRNLRKLKTEERMQHASKWISNNRIKNLISSYSKKYGVAENIAHWELLELGCHEQISIQFYEKAGIEWEYKCDGYTGETYIVPVGTKDWELDQLY